MEKYIIDEFVNYFTFTKNLPIKRLSIFLNNHKDIDDYCKHILLEIPEYDKKEYVLYAIIKNRPIYKCKELRFRAVKLNGCYIKHIGANRHIAY